MKNQNMKAVIIAGVLLAANAILGEEAPKPVIGFRANTFSPLQPFREVSSV